MVTLFIIGIVSLSPAMALKFKLRGDFQKRFLISSVESTALDNGLANSKLLRVFRYVAVWNTSYYFSQEVYDMICAWVNYRLCIWTSVPQEQRYGWAWNGREGTFIPSHRPRTFINFFREKQSQMCSVIHIISSISAGSWFFLGPADS